MSNNSRLTFWDPISLGNELPYSRYPDGTVHHARRLLIKGFQGGILSGSARNGFSTTCCESFTKASKDSTGFCDPHLLLLQPSKRDPRYASPPPRLAFTFVREARSPSRGSYFSFMTEWARCKMNDVGFPNFSITTGQFSSDICIDDGFRHEALQMEWNGVLVNVPFKGWSYYVERRWKRMQLRELPDKVSQV
ncbi:hypothetical protein AVEN_253985-1 [Araneus ventricosus]|uniref:Uncharacterized protein n=1 Tax=Araneus ventricosus TaxID=182803 RepID=A0A4Y2GQ57_ARAVE|nr:hypothetical protein AVEN_253985-1 [Araneus ventricosus]